MKRATTFHFVQDVPTPHNNTLLKALRDEPGIELCIWYAQLTLPQYSFSDSLAYEVKQPIVYGSRIPNWRLIRRAVFNRRDKWVVVGWTNPTTRLLVPLLWMLRRPYNMWFDLPSDPPRSWVKSRLRLMYYFFLRTSTAKVFAVGQHAIAYFRDRGFHQDRLISLPIFVDLDKRPSEYRVRRAEIRARYGVGDGELFVTAGSRLLHAKGFDLLIRAIAMLDTATRSSVRVLIIGKGDEKEALIRQIVASGLEGRVFIEEWMSNEVLREHIASSDVLVHPARFDAFGGATLTAMAVGVPVIGSVEAGSTLDRVQEGVNGWLYSAEDVSRLSELIRSAYVNRLELSDMGASARQIAEIYAPSTGARVLTEHSV